MRCNDRLTRLGDGKWRFHAVLLRHSSQLHTSIFCIHSVKMAVGSSSRSQKRSQVDVPAEYDNEEEETTETSASHLVSFLTGYENNHNVDIDAEHDSDDDHDGREDGSEDEDDEDVDNDDDDPDELEATPTKRAKTGLVGSSTPRSTRSTPGKRKTPRKAATTPSLFQIREDQPGFIRPSKADAYFYSTARSSKTSGNSYSALVKPLSTAQYERYASKARSHGKSKSIVESMVRDAEDRHDQWETELEEGFNLLFYGFGSKRRVLNDLVRQRLSTRGHCVVINGHFPGTTIRDVLGQIEDNLGIPQDTPTPSSAVTPLDRSAFRTYAHFLPQEAIPTAKRSLWPVSDIPLYLVIHNIDSPSLRTPRSLAILALLASSPNIHLVATFDHLHTPLLFSSTISNTPPHFYTPGGWTGVPLPSRGFNWVYHNLTTYDDYDLELTYQRLASSSTLITSNTAGISEEGALQILRSVPPMALRLLKLLLTKQLSSLPPDAASHTAHPATAIAPVFAIDNDTLQRLSREKFIAREEERYNALMGEFKDHGLVVEAQGDSEGRTGRWIWVPLGKAAVERVLETMTEVEV